MKITNIELNKVQYGWTCKVYFMLHTKRQFTKEHAAAEGFHKNPLVAFFFGLLAVRKAKRILQSIPGEFCVR